MTVIESHQIYTDDGSISKTTRVYAKRYAQLMPTKTNDLLKFSTPFEKVIEERSFISQGLENNEENLFGEDYRLALMMLHGFFEEMEIVNRRSPGTQKYLIDLPSMILYSMILESKTKRTWFESFDSNAIMAALKEIHHQCVELCSYQIQYDEQTFVLEHKSDLKLFVSFLQETQSRSRSRQAYRNL